MTDVTNPPQTLVDLGPEMFSDARGLVINYKGENFYKACGEFVAGDPEGAGSYCVQRVDHPGRYCVDYAGNRRVRDAAGGATSLKALNVDFPMDPATGMPVLRSAVKEAWEKWAKPIQHRDTPPTDYERTLMTLFRAVYAAMPEDSEVKVAIANG